MVSNAKLAKVWFLAYCQVRVREFVEHDRPIGGCDKMGAATNSHFDKSRVNLDKFS